jgi:tetratricopeptide (TPR) repeat protein
LLSLSRRPEAIAALRRAAAVAPQADIGRLSLAHALMAEERQDEAIAVLPRMLARNPTNFDARKMLGDVLSFGGWFEEAEQEYQRAIDTGNQPITAYHSLVNLRKLTEADRPLIEGMRRVLQRGGLQDFSLMILNFSLGKALDDLNDYAAAMEHFDAANRLRNRTSKLDRARLTEQFDGLIARFATDYFATHAALGCDDETPLLVLGMPRSGTTLTEQIVSSHPAVVGGGELPFWLETGAAWDAGGMRSMTSENARRVAEDYLTVLRDLGPDAARVTDKMPPNFMWIGLIHLIFPKARIIHCKRNPIDTCLSIYSTYFTARMDFAADRGDLMFFYRQYKRLMEHWQKVLPPAVYYETTYEELVADREVRSRELIAFCGLDWNEACLVPEQNERQVRTASTWQARQPVYKTAVERWRRYNKLTISRAAGSVPAAPRWLGDPRIRSEDGNDDKGERRQRGRDGKGERRQQLHARTCDRPRRGGHTAPQATQFPPTGPRGPVPGRASPAVCRLACNDRATWETTVRRPVRDDTAPQMQSIRPPRSIHRIVASLAAPAAN